MNFILMVTAALFAIVSVAAADELPRTKPRSPTTAAPSQKVRDATRPVPVRRGGLQQRNDGRVPPASARQSDRPAAEGAATNSPDAVPGEQHGAGGGPAERNAQPSAGERPGASVGGE